MQDMITVCVMPSPLHFPLHWCEQKVRNLKEKCSWKPGYLIKLQTLAFRSDWEIMPKQRCQNRGRNKNEKFRSKCVFFWNLSASSRHAHLAFCFSINLRKYIENFQRVRTIDRTNNKKKMTVSQSLLLNTVQLLKIFMNISVIFFKSC